MKQTASVSVKQNWYSESIFQDSAIHAADRKLADQAGKGKRLCMGTVAVKG